MATEPATSPLLTDLEPSDLRALKRQLVNEIQAEEMERTRRDAEAIRTRCESFEGFVKEAWHVIEPGTSLRWNWHLTAMCAHLEAVSDGRLPPWGIINVPPGSSKSTIVAVLWQAWEWGPRGQRHLRYVSTSFEEGNVTRDTRKCRDLIRSEWYRTLWPEVEMVRAGETSFANSDTGSREGVTFAGITGKRGDRVVIDDPHSVKGAESEAERTRTVREFLEGGLNRSNDALTSAMIVVMQRLHETDLTGALLARKLGFWHLMIPMEFEPERRCTTPLVVEGGRNWTDPRTYTNELMDPGRFPQEAVDRQKEAGDYAWAGQYQQRPAPRGGGMFKVPEDWALDRSEGGRVVTHCPDGGRTVAGWDAAGSKRKTSPYSVRVKMTRVGGDYYIRHVVRRRTDPTELDQMVRDVVKDDGLGTFQSLPQDPGQAGKSQKWAWAEQLAGYDFKITPETGDKETRAEPFAAQWGAGRVFLVKGDWNSEYIDELRGFPAGTYKDQVDASSRAFAELVGIDTAPPPNAGPIVIEGGDDIDSMTYAYQRRSDEPEVDPWGG
jgi:predicted phage terminase large subunit-like protein